MDEESTPNDQIYSRGRTSFFDSENNSEFGLAVPAVGVHHWRMAIRSLGFAFFFSDQRKACIMSKLSIIKIHATLAKYSRTKQLQNSIPNLCKKSNRRSHRHTLSKLAENKRPKNGDQHPCRLERVQFSSSLLRLSSSSFCHR